MDKRIPQLDGIRGAAALTVVIAHYFGEVASGFEPLSVGWLGVEVFFVLSGFLIGGIILDARDQPGFWRGFFLRRAARILPVYLLTVALVIAMGATFSPWVYLTFTQNMAPAFQGMDLIFTHPLWTLAVEEQFYLLLPLVVVATPRRLLPAALMAMFIGALVFRMAVYPASPSAASLFLPARMDLLSAGVLAAWAARNLPVERMMLALRIAPIPLLFAASGVHRAFGMDAFIIYGQSLIALGVAAFLLTVSKGAPEFRGFLSSRVLGFFGTISFALYLLHQPVNYLMHTIFLGAAPDVASPLQIAVTSASVVLSVLAAWLSWVLMERPILEASRRLLNARPAKPGLAQAVVA